MSPFLFVFLLMPSGEVQAAIRAPNGSEFSASFPNTEKGTRQFVTWATSQANFNEKSKSHSCLAAASGGDAKIYSTAFFEFAYRGTSNTNVWSETSLQEFLPGVGEARRSASAMLTPCARQHQIS